MECSVAYSSLDQESRQQNLDRFRKKLTRVLIVTDVAARGIDIPLLNNVVNFDFPATKTVKLFVHRVGRAARQGRTGTTFSFVTADELPFLVDVCLFIGIKLDSYEKRNPESAGDPIEHEEGIEILEKDTRTNKSHCKRKSER